MNSDGIIILVDEKGDPGSTSKSSKEFTITASINNDPGLLIRIVESTEKGTRYPDDIKFRGELKYWSSSDDIRRNVLLRLRETNPKVYAVHINKRDIRPGTTSKSTYATLTRDLMDEVMKDEVLRNKAIIVIFDETDHLEERKARDIVMSAAANNGLFGMKREDIIKESSKNNKLLQAHDFFAGAVGSKYIDGRTDDYCIISDIATVYSSHIKKK